MNMLFDFCKTERFSISYCLALSKFLGIDFIHYASERFYTDLRRKIEKEYCYIRLYGGLEPRASSILSTLWKSDGQGSQVMIWIPKVFVASKTWKYENLFSLYQSSRVSWTCLLPNLFKYISGHFNSNSIKDSSYLPNNFHN